MKKIKFLFTLLVLIGLLSNCSLEDNEPSVQTIQDNDGNKYETVDVGEQTWMKENLKTTTYNDGVKILNITSSEEWLNTTMGGQCAYDNSEYNVEKSGRLYNWHAVGTQKLCPEGWHVPSRDEWVQLRHYLDSIDYNSAKSIAASSGWDESSYEYDSKVGTNQSENNKTGFSGIPAGSRAPNGNFMGKGSHTEWHASDVPCQYCQPQSAGIGSDSEEMSIGSSGSGTNAGKSVRCIKD
jgi:uncharacterized protein (TIGR02145 family)